jgi:myosin-7
MAKMCMQRLEKITQLGMRKFVPSKEELDCLKEGKPVPIKVRLLNDTTKTFQVDSYMLVQDLLDQLCQSFNLTVTSPFALYQMAEPGVDLILDPKDRVLDVLASWENAPLDEPKGSDKKKYQVKKEVKKKSKEEAKWSSFLFKAKLMIKTTSDTLMTDQEAVNLTYVQAVSDVVTNRYPSTDKDVTVLAALQLQATHGDFIRGQHNPGWLLPKLREYMPILFLQKKGKMDSKLEKEYEANILSKWEKVKGFTIQEAKLNYLDYVQEWQFYGSTFWLVEQRQFKDYPSPLLLGINSEGVLLMHPEKRHTLEIYNFTDIVTWGHAEEKFIVVVGNIVQQRKLIFKTQMGKAMNQLIHDYVNFKVKGTTKA